MWGSLKQAEIFELKECTSTQDLGRNYLQNNPQNCAWFRADLQVAGRGREGRSWEGLSGNLFLSCAFRFEMEGRELSFLPLVAGLAAYNILKNSLSIKDSLQVKWPNDIIWLQEKTYKKLGGVLVESFAKDRVLVGWGINLKSAPPGLPAECLENLDPNTPLLNPKLCLQALKLEFESLLTAWGEDPTFKGRMIERLQNEAMAWAWGRSCQSPSGQSYLAHSLNPDGSLRVIDPTTQNFHNFCSGEIRFQ